jgi:hypothetical protein
MNNVKIITDLKEFPKKIQFLVQEIFYSFLQLFFQKRLQCKLLKLIEYFLGKRDCQNGNM